MLQNTKKARQGKRGKSSNEVPIFISWIIGIFAHEKIFPTFFFLSVAKYPYSRETAWLYISIEDRSNVLVLFFVYVESPG